VLHTYHLIGFALIVFGLVLVNLDQRKPIVSPGERRRVQT